MRLIYSLVSAVLGAGTCGAWVAGDQLVGNAHGNLSAMGLSTAVLFFDPWVIFLSLPGWALAVPGVLLVVLGFQTFCFTLLLQIFPPPVDDDGTDA